MLGFNKAGPSLASIILVLWAVSSGYGAHDVIQTYGSDALSTPLTAFPDGEPLYFTASDGATKGGVKTAVVP